MWCLVIMPPFCPQCHEFLDELTFQRGPGCCLRWVVLKPQHFCVLSQWGAGSLLSSCCPAGQASCRPPCQLHTPRSAVVACRSWTHWQNAEELPSEVRTPPAVPHFPQGSSELGPQDLRFHDCRSRQSSSNPNSSMLEVCLSCWNASFFICTFNKHL